MRPVNESHQGNSNAGTASRAAANTSVNMGYQQRNQLASRNDTMHNSHIQGRKVDSPKIYVKDVNERPKTSAQQVRKTPQNTSAVMKAKPVKNRDRYNEPKKLNQNFLCIAPQTNKDAEHRKFDFKFVSTAKAATGDKGKKVGGKKKTNLNKSQVINLHGDKSGHHRTQTIHAGILNYDSNLKIRASATDNTVNNVLDSQVVQWSDVAKAKTGKNLSQNSNMKRKRHQSLNMPKNTNADSATQIQDQHLINIQLPGTSSKMPTKKQYTSSGAKAIPTKPPIQVLESFGKVRRKQHMHNQTMVIAKTSEYTYDGPKIPKTQRSGQINASSNSVMTAQERKRTKSGDRSSVHAADDFKYGIKHAKGYSVSKTQRNKKDTHHSHSGLHDLKNAASRRNNAHFSFDIVNQENVCSNSSQNINEKQNLSISSNSSNSKNAQKDNLGKLFKNNFFVDGAQLLRHMSPGTPEAQRSIEKQKSIEVSDHIINVKTRDGSNSRSRGRPSTRQTSGNRPHSKAMSGMARQPVHEDSAKATLDHDQLHAHKKNKIQILTDHDDSMSAQNRDSLLKKGFLSQQLSANDRHDAHSNGSYRNDRSKKTSGLDKLVKRNIKKKQKLNTEELIKKFMEETQKKQKKADINNRNQEVRKMNAKQNEQDRLQALLNKNYKKKRSKSCINKTDNIFMKGFNITRELDLKDKKGKREKSNDQKGSVLSGILDPLLSKKNQEVSGRNNAVIELTKLKQEIDNEIRRDRKEGKLDLLSPCSNPVKKPEVQQKVKKINKDLNLSKGNYASLRIVDQDVLFERKNQNESGNIKNKIRQDENEKLFGSSGQVGILNNMNNTKIQKFIEKQKKRKAAKKSLEETQQHEKTMKVHQNLLNLHNFTKNDRNKKPLKTTFFNIKKTSKDQQSQLLEHIRNHPILNLKVGKKRKTSIENNSDRHRSNSKKQQAKQIKIAPLRYRGKQSISQGLDNDTDLLEQTIQIDSSRMEGHDVDNSIINLYRKLSGSRKSSNGSAIRSAMRSESADRNSPQRRSLSGGRTNEHPPLKVLKPNKISSPGMRPRVSTAHQQSTGSAHLRKKHQNQIEHVMKNSRFFGKDSPDAYKNLNQSMPGKDNLITVSPNRQHDSIEAASKQQLTSDQFESLEPTRTAKQIKKSDARMSSVASQASAQNFDQRVQELANKYGQLGENESKLLVRLHTAAVKIQYHCRKHIQEKKRVVPSKNLEAIDLELRKQATSDREIKISSSRDGTGQSLRKSVIPTLDLEKLASQKSRPRAQQETPYLANTHVKDELEPPVSTSRSIFARNTFRDFMDKMGVTSLEDFNVDNFPEMMKIREKAISHRQKHEESKITTAYRQKQISPRTYDLKRKELEVWVSKEHDEVKQTKKFIEDEHQKTAKLLNVSASNSEQIKRILNGNQDYGANHHNVSKNSQNPQPTLTDRARSARLSSRRGDGKTHLLAMIYQQNGDASLRKGSEPRPNEDLISESESLNSKKGVISPVVQVTETDHSPTNEHDESLSKVIIINPNALKNFPQTAQKAEQKKSFTQSNQKSSIQTSDNPESLRDLMSEQGLNKLKTPKDHTNTDRSLDIDGAVDPELEDQFNKHISQQLLGKLISEEREKSITQSERESSAKVNKKNGDIAPTGPFKQRRQAFEVAPTDKPLHRVSSQQQLQDNRDLEMYSEEQKRSYDSEEKSSSNHFDNSKQGGGLQIAEDEDELARQVMEISPVSNSNTQIAFSKDDLKDSIRSETFFLNNLNKINSGNATSLDDLQEFSPEQKDMIAHLQGSESYEIPALQTHSVTTPLSEGNNDKIRIEISGQQLSNSNDGFQLAQSFPMNQLLGAPVSPLSTDSFGGIKCGATSLSSNTSEEKGMPLPGMLSVIPEISEENKSRIESSNYRGELQELQDTNKSLQLSCLDTTGQIDSANKTSLESTHVKMIEELGKNLPKELKESGEKLADEIYQLLLVELAIDLPVITNRNIQRGNDTGYHFKDQAHGIKTDLFAIERYVDEVQTEVMGNKKEFMDTLAKPLSKDSLATLNMLQNSEIGSCEHFEENYTQILHLDLYLTLEKRRKEKRERQILDMEELDSGTPKTQSQVQNNVLRTFLAECEHIHNKVLFDCINDSLLQFKPFSKEGTPLPWSRQNRRLKPAEDFTINEIFEIVKHDLFRWAITQSGTLPRREMVYQGVFDQDLFDEIREKKLVHMLCCEMVENEPKWLNYEFEHAQVKIDVGDMILEQLVNETIALLSQNANRDLDESMGGSLLDNSKSHNIEDSWPSAN